MHIGSYIQCYFNQHVVNNDDRNNKIHRKVTYRSSHMTSSRHIHDKPSNDVVNSAPWRHCKYVRQVNDSVWKCTVNSGQLWRQERYASVWRATLYLSKVNFPAYSDVKKCETSPGTSPEQAYQWSDYTKLERGLISN